MRLQQPALRGNNIHYLARDSRVTAEFRRMKTNFSAVAAADHRTDNLGHDPLVDQIISAVGLDGRQAFSARLLVQSRQKGPGSYHRITALVVAARVWHCEDDRALVHEVVRLAKAERTRCIIVTQKSISARGRLASATVIAASRDVTCSASEHLTIVGSVLEQGWSTLGDCASLIRNHSDPVGAVLSIVAAGGLRIDRRRPLSPHSRIDAVV